MQTERGDVLEQVLEWYKSKDEVRDIQKAGIDTVLTCGVTGAYQANLVVDACEAYLKETDVDETERTEIESLAADFSVGID